MSDPIPSDQLRAAFQPAPDCPDIGELGRYLHQPEGCPPSIGAHVSQCFVCQAELELMRQFDSAEILPEEELPLKHITQKLAKARVPPKRDHKARIWAAAACLLVTSGAVYYWRQAEPVISGGPSQVLRTQQLRLTMPAGDQTSVPAGFRWEPFAGAASYHLKVMEVDRTTIWENKVNGPGVTTPTTLAAKIVPGKTLLWEVSALDSVGHTIATSEALAFRIPLRAR
jgi:hypothetical protein